MVVVLLATGCGGASTRSRNDGNDQGAAPSGGTTANVGTGVGGTDLGVGGRTAAGGSASGGTAQDPRPIDLGDGDHVVDGAPVVPPDIASGGFFWQPCGNGGWKLGNWFVTSDRPRDAFPRAITPPREGSTQAHGATGADFEAGVALWVQLDHPSGRPVQLSGCSAVSFWARLESPSGQVVVALNDGSRPSGELDGRSTLPSRTLHVGPDWQELTLPFESFSPGLSADGPSLASIELFVGDGGETFDLWVDDLSLICAGGCQ